MPRLIKVSAVQKKVGRKGKLASAGWAIAGTDLILIGIFGLWRFVVTRPAGRAANDDWLRANNLKRAEFPTRTAALRAFDAAAAVRPPPPAAPPPRLRRVKAGRYACVDVPGVTIRNSGDSNMRWEINGLPGSSTRYAATLALAAEIIADHLTYLELTEAGAA